MDGTVEDLVNLVSDHYCTTCYEVVSIDELERHREEQSENKCNTVH